MQFHRIMPSALNLNNVQIFRELSENHLKYAWQLDWEYEVTSKTPPHIPNVHIESSPFVCFCLVYGNRLIRFYRQ